MAPTLEVRRPAFGIDDTVPFQWQPANPAFGVFGNAFTFVAIAFERYVVSATRGALARIDDADVAAEADLFVRQEAQHAKAHRAHAMAMIAAHPGLAETLAAANRAYDELLDREPVEFHLAYVASLEAVFTPLFKLVLDNRHGLFVGADERVGTLLLWHFVEEIEHRSAAFHIHRHVTPDPWFRIRQTPKVVRHVSGVFQLVLDGFAEHVDADAFGMDLRDATPLGMPRSELRHRLRRSKTSSAPGSMLGHVPGADLRSMLWRLARTQTPRHDPTHEPLPAWVDGWHHVWRAGGDVTTYEGVRLSP